MFVCVVGAGYADVWMWVCVRCGYVGVWGGCGCVCVSMKMVNKYM